MAAPVETETSSSEDEETKQRIREAVTGFAVATHASKTIEKNAAPVTQSLPSLRPDREVPDDADRHDHHNQYHITPGLKKHLAKLLTNVLDSDIDSTATCFVPKKDKTTDGEGIKLFASSSRLFRNEDEVDKVPSKKRPREWQPPSSSSDDSSEDERLASAAVSHDFIINQSQCSYSTNHKPADVVIRPEDADSPETMVQGEGKKKKNKKAKRRKSIDDQNLTEEPEGIVGNKNDIEDREEADVNNKHGGISGSCDEKSSKKKKKKKKKKISESRE